MGWRASVLGASGYAGGELLRLLGGHPNIDVAWVSAGSNAGRALGEVHPQLASMADRPLLAADDPRLGEADVFFLALPHGESAAVVERIGDADAVVVDLGADFRLADETDWEGFYGGAHAGTWPYGLPELPGSRSALADQRRIANPGCYPTAVALALAPLLAAGLVEADDVVVVAASGTSGAGRAARPSLLGSGGRVESEEAGVGRPGARGAPGRAARPSLLGSEVMGDLSAYKPAGAHQHLPEMRQSLSAAAAATVTLSFTPVLAPMPRGILATCTARLTGGADTGALRA